MKRRDIIKNLSVLPFAGSFLPLTSAASPADEKELLTSGPLSIGPNIYESIGVTLSSIAAVHLLSSEDRLSGLKSQLSEGAVADVVVLSLGNGNFGFVDAGGNKIESKQKFEAELTIRAGKVVWDINGISAVKFAK
jgi:predicted amidohydrolase